jgi:alpha-galactosidase
MRLLTLFVALILILVGSAAYAKTEGGGENKILIAVKTDPSDADVKVTVQLEKGPENTQYLQIEIQNKSGKPVTLLELETKLPTAGPVGADAELLFGGTCMGRTPIQRYLATDEEMGESSMFVMVKHGEEKYSFAGSLSWRRFLPYFHFENGEIVLRADLDRKWLDAGGTVEFEKILLATCDDWQDMLDLFGTEIADENDIKNTKPADFKGWSTWDYYGRQYTDKDIYANMAALKEMDAGANMIQIDGGWWTERGDYLSVRDGLPDGMKGVAKRIVENGLTPGIHIDGFRADAASTIFKEHPEYFLRNQDDEPIINTVKKVDREMNYVFFDYSHPDARKYIRDCIKTIKEDWGFKYFKVDFMRYGLNPWIISDVRNMDVKEVRGHVPGITGIQRFRRGMKTIKDAIGDDAYFLGCSAVFGPCIGYVDGMRTGGDVSPVFENYKARCVQNGGNYYLHNKVFNADSDYLVFRAKEDEDDTVTKSNDKHGGTISLGEAKMWADFTVMVGDAKFESDNLQTLRDERKGLVKYAFSYKPMDRVVPLDLWDHGRGKEDAFSFFLGSQSGECYLALFNWDETDDTFNISGFKKGGRVKAMPKGRWRTVDNGRMVVKMVARSSVIYKYDGRGTFDSLRKDLIFTRNGIAGGE